MLKTCVTLSLAFFFSLLDSLLVTPSPEILQCWKSSYKHLTALFNNAFCIFYLLILPRLSSCSSVKGVPSITHLGGS